MKIKLNYELEAVFLRNVVDALEVIRLQHDRKREAVSTTLSKVFNAEWGKRNVDIQRGAIIGVLKTGETAMNDTLVHMVKLQLLVKSRVSELYACKNEEDKDAVKTQKKKIK